MASVSSGKGSGKPKAAYAAPKLTTYGNVSELTGGPSMTGVLDGKNPNSGSMA